MGGRRMALPPSFRSPLLLPSPRTAAPFPIRGVHPQRTRPCLRAKLALGHANQMALCLITPRQRASTKTRRTGRRHSRPRRRPKTRA